MGASTVIYGTSSREESIQRIHSLYETIQTILKTADDSGRPPSEVADDVALERIAAARDP